MINTYVSVAFLADALQISESVIRYWAARKLIPGAIKIGRSWRFRLADCSQWLEDKHTETEEQKAWFQSTNGPVAPSTKPELSLVELHDASPLARALRERLSRKENAAKKKRMVG